MASREGNLEAPTRHAVDWKNDEYYDEGSLFTELERVFDLCMVVVVVSACVSLFPLCLT